MRRAGFLRAHPRGPVPGVELFCRLASGEARRNVGRGIVDLSPGGACLRLAGPVSTGDALVLELRDRRTRESFRARGEVRWAAGRGASTLTGVQFGEVYVPPGNRTWFARETLGPSAKGFEKRDSARFSVDDYEVTCRRRGGLSSAGLKRNLARRVLDLSPSGARLILGEPLHAGEFVQFSLRLDRTGESIEAMAETRWCRPDPGVSGARYSAGLQFMDLSEEFRRKIELVQARFGTGRRRST